MKIKVFRIVSVLLLLALAVTIFCLSGQDATESDGTSQGFTYKVFCVIYPHFKEFSSEKQTEIIEGFSFVVRKTAHFSLYFMLGALSFLSVITYKKPRFWIKTAVAYLFCVLYAVSDEIHQYFIPGRSCELRDVLIDSLGALSAIAILVILCISIKKIKEKLF